MYAIIKTGGKQYRVQEGDNIFVEKLNADVDSNVVFDQVLAVVNDGDVKVGTPVVEGAKVTAKVLAQGKEKKVLVFKYKAKSITMHRDKRDRYTGFTIKGHADYDEAGSDIVCAAVSALSQTALLGLIQYASQDVPYEVNDGFLSVQVPKPCEASQIILGTMVAGLEQIVRQYGEYVVLDS